MGDIRLILTVDGLSAPYLGPYGGSWVATPGFNRLASQGCVWDNAIAPTLDGRENVAAMWSAHTQQDTNISLFEQYERSGCETVLIHDGAEWFNDLDTAGQIVDVGLEKTTECHSVSALSETRMAAICGAALEQLDQLEADEGLLIWVHTRGMFGPWDAPAEYVQNLLDDEDPIPPTYITPPQRAVTPDEDPDILLGIRQSYAAQVAVMDACLEMLLDHPRLQQESSEFYLIGLRGYPLGEHGYIGISAQTPLYSESLGVPVIIKSRALTQQRWRGLMSLSDFRDLLVPEVPRPYALPTREFARVRHGEQVVIRTQEWLLREAEGARQLFAKPDDRFECNDVADIMGDVAEELCGKRPSEAESKDQ